MRYFFLLLWIAFCSYGVWWTTLPTPAPRWHVDASKMGSTGHRWPIPRAIYLEDDTVWGYDRARKQWVRQK